MCARTLVAVAESAPVRVAAYVIARARDFVGALVTVLGIASVRVPAVIMVAVRVRDIVGVVDSHRVALRAPARVITITAARGVVFPPVIVIGPCR